MNPLSMVFGAGVAIRNALYERGALKTNKLKQPVISVGNISVGGAGKTPFVIALGELLKQRGIAFDVLSRGYGRDSTEIAVVDPLGSPQQFGDEPLLIARKLQVPVIVGADRYRAGLLAEEKFSSRLHLLDDGFQHRGLHRDFDIVLLPQEDLEGTLLPTGRLREPRSSLRRADAVVLFAPNDPNFPGPVPGKFKARIFWACRVTTQYWTDERLVAFCAIARPQQFFDRITELGQKIAGRIAFRDHHRYTQADIDKLLQLRRKRNGQSFITTEKDLINLGPLAAQLQPLRTVELRIELGSPEQTLAFILEKIEQRSGCRL
jgi:tetraacyldisaccharide 4'-kinase